MLATVYSDLLGQTRARLALSLLVVAYWAVGIYGGISMQENFSPEKIFNSQSFLARSLRENEKVCLLFRTWGKNFRSSAAQDGQGFSRLDLDVPRP